MKSYIKLIFGIISLGIIACEDYNFETETPTHQGFTVYEVITDEFGNDIKGNPIETVKPGQKVHLEVMTSAHLATIWTGDYDYRPWGTTDSLLDSHNYEHYGELGAQGFPMTPMEGALGFFKVYSWNDPGAYPIALILTNHGVANPDYKRNVFNFDVSVAE